MSPTPTPAPRWPAAVLRAVVAVHAALVLVQAALAGRYLSGDAGALTLHEANGTEVITVVAMAQIVAAVLVWRPGRGRAWPMAASVALLAAETAQITFGFSGLRALHVPLGVAISGVTVALLVGSWQRPRRAVAP